VSLQAVVTLRERADNDNAMAELTISQWIAKQQKFRAQLRLGKPLAIAARTVHSERIKRIFHDGLNSAGASIGNYNRTREIWMKNTELRRTNRGKSGRAEKTSYFQSYYALKADQGFNPDVVNLRLTNDLQSDFANARLSKSDDSVPTDPPIKVSPTLWKEELRRADNAEKVEALERRFGRIFAPTKRERDEFQRVGELEMKKLLLEAGWSSK